MWLLPVQHPLSQEASIWANSGLVLPALARPALRPDCLVFDFGGREARQMRVRGIRGVIQSARTFVISGYSRLVIVGAQVFSITCSFF